MENLNELLATLNTPHSLGVGCAQWVPFKGYRKRGKIELLFSGETWQTLSQSEDQGLVSSVTSGVDSVVLDMMGEFHFYFLRSSSPALITPCNHEKKHQTNPDWEILYLTSTPQTVKVIKTESDKWSRPKGVTAITFSKWQNCRHGKQTRSCQGWREAGCEYKGVTLGRSLWCWSSSVCWLQSCLYESTRDKVV